MSDKIKITGTGCGYVLEELAKLECDNLSNSAFLQIMALEDELKKSISYVQEAITKTGYTAEDTEIFKALANKGQLKSASDDREIEAINRHNRMIELSNEPQEIEGLPVDFEIPEIALKTRRLLYDLKRK